MPLVLVSTDASNYDWKDITGVQYHYPNGYKNLIYSSVPFVYYRGWRADGTRGQAEYFGRGVVGSIWRDPEIPTEELKARWAWYCAVEEYAPFVPPVPAKIDGRHLEPIQHENAWRNGVRTISDAVYQEILAAAGWQGGGRSLRTLPSIDKVAITQVPAGTLLVSRPSANVMDEAAVEKTTTANGRYSRSAKLIGDRAEEIVLRWLTATQPSATAIRWVAKEGQTPGWDIEFVDGAGAFVAVEVKGTSGPRVESFEVTANELLAMHSRRSKYWLVLVADCLGTAPQVEVIADPASQLGAALVAEPVRWQIAKAPTVETSPSVAPSGG